MKRHYPILPSSSSSLSPYQSGEQNTISLFYYTTASAGFDDSSVEVVGAVEVSTAVVVAAAGDVNIGWTLA